MDRLCVYVQLLTQLVSQPIFMDKIVIATDVQETMKGLVLETFKLLCSRYHSQLATIETVYYGMNTSQHATLQCLSSYIMVLFCSITEHYFKALSYIGTHYSQLQVTRSSEIIISNQLASQLDSLLHVVILFHMLQVITM